MKRPVVTLLASVFLVLSIGTVVQAFPVSDVRALGMGGAYVAAGSGIGAVQYNPALLGEGGMAALSVPNLVLKAEDQGGLIDAIDDLNPPAFATTAELEAAVGRLDGKLVLLEGAATAGVGMQAFGIGLGVSYANLVSGAVVPSIPVTDSNDPSFLTSNTLVFQGLDIRQLILTGAKELGPVTVGVNLRQISGTAYLDTANIFNDPDIDLDSVTDGLEEDVSGTAIDLGAVWPLAPTLTLGIVIKDANEPDLDGIELERSIRAGAALDLPVVLLAADYDMTVPEDATGDENRAWSLGAELDLPVLELRGGLSNNGLDGAPTLMHLGLGLGAELFKIDLGAAYADEGDYYAAGVNLSMKF